MDRWQASTGDTAPANLTPDRFDRKTGERRFKGLLPPRRGTMPGSEAGATSIHDPGPR